ncbi:MAG: Gfo/Idh/MocA family oxidoreductase [Planctomycetaceae bacterium]|jgi:predicted dehydrogenase|nr:Gfo/Idh/MocA family oxidoreductase [Planctomycetaceae bacterium]
MKVKLTGLSRRRFIGITGGVAAAFFASPFIISEESKGANDRIGIGAIGVGGMGSGDTKSAARFGNVVAIADADLRHAEKLKSAFGGKPTTYQDYRKLLENKNVDVIIQATPDHWHTKINVESLLAGKDVYGEKPITLTINEGQILCEVVKKTKRIFQTGTMQRSDKKFQTAIELVRNGRIGKLKRVLVALPYYSSWGGPFKAVAVPNELDWDLYQGQAPVQPYLPQRTHAIFRWWYEYAGGMVTDWGNHHMDIAHWGMDQDYSGPLTVEGRGIFPNENKPDCFNTPDRFYAVLKYPNDVELLFYTVMAEKPGFHGSIGHKETTKEQFDWLFGKNCPQEVHDNKRNGIMFIGDKGRLFVNRGGLFGKPVEELKENPLPENGWKVKPSNDHMKNFFDCVKSREVPVASADLEHHSLTPCHLTNISIRLGGRKLQWDAAKEEITNDKEANSMLKREQRDKYRIEV